MRLNFDQQAEVLAPYHAHNWGMDKVVAGEDITRILGEEVQSGTLWGELKYVNIHVWKEYINWAQHYLNSATSICI